MQSDDSAPNSPTLSPNLDISQLLSSAQGEIEDNLGLLLYGSGGSVDDDASAKALSILSVNYVRDLCEAAMRNHEAMVGSCMSRALHDACDGRKSSHERGPGVHNILHPLDFGVDVNDLAVDAEDGVTGVDDVSQSDRSQGGRNDSNEKDDSNNYHLESTTCLRIGSQSFIRAVMHDRLQYGRIKEVLSARRSIGYDLLDQTIISTVQDEVGDGGVWPGSENMLPLHD